MIRQRFREERSSLGIVLRPVAEVILENNGFAVEIPMYIDSDADVSMIPFRFGRALGFKQEEDTIQEIKGVSGAGVPYILKEVTLVLNGKKLKVRIAWALVEEVPMFMGRMDIFDKFRGVFDERMGGLILRNDDGTAYNTVFMVRSAYPNARCRSHFTNTENVIHHMTIPQWK